MYQLEFPQFSISRSAFQELRPVHAKPLSTLNQRVCMCLYHANVHFLLKALAKYVDNLKDDTRVLVNSLVCDDTNETCMIRKCSTCQHFFKKKINNHVRNKKSSLTWTQWVHNGNRFTRSEFTGTVQQCVAVLETKISPFLLHTWIKREQSKYFEDLKENVSSSNVVIQVDYSQNFSISFQDEIQSAHWSKEQLSVFTAHVWLSDSTSKSFAFVSDDSRHNKYTVNACLERLFTTLQRDVPDLNEVAIFPMVHHHNLNNVTYSEILLICPGHSIY